MKIFRSIRTLIICLPLLLTLPGSCGFFKPHKINVQQGNIITAEMVSQLEPGLTKNQVEYILGTPLIVDTFTPDTWYYHYTLRLGSGGTLFRSLKLNFVDDKLAEYISNPPFEPGDESSVDEPSQQLLKSESKKLERSLPTELEDSQRDAGL